MKAPFIYFSTVTEGKLQPSVSKAIKNDLMNFNGKRIQITIQRQKSIRSLNQNRLYWAYITILSNDLGYTKENMHDIIKYKFLKVEEELGNETVVMTRSTAQLTKSEFMDFIDELQRWSAEMLNIILPDPNTQVNFNF